MPFRTARAGGRASGYLGGRSEGGPAGSTGRRVSVPRLSPGLAGLDAMAGQQHGLGAREGSRSDASLARSRIRQRDLYDRRGRRAQVCELQSRGQRWQDVDPGHAGVNPRGDGDARALARGRRPGPQSTHGLLGALHGSRPERGTPEKSGPPGGSARRLGKHPDGRLDRNCGFRLYWLRAQSIRSRFVSVFFMAPSNSIIPSEGPAPESWRRMACDSQSASPSSSSSSFRVAESGRSIAG